MAQSVKTESLKQNTADSSECALKQSVKTSERQNETLIGSDLCGSDLSIDNLRGNVLCENALSGNARYENALRKYPAQALVDLNALRNNAARLVETVNSARSESGSGAAVMGVVKADAYGHGLIPAALASLAGGASWLGTAQPREALALRKAGIAKDRAHILAWLFSCDYAPFEELIENDIDIAAGSFGTIREVAAAAEYAGKTARVHIKCDTGFGRNGFTEDNFDEALRIMKPFVSQGLIEVIGQFSHLAVADMPEIKEFEDCTDEQIKSFHRFTSKMSAAGLEPQIRHLANSAATFTRPDIHFEMVRPGISFYGYAPDVSMGTPDDFSLVPAMTLQAQLGTIKKIRKSCGISYGRKYVTENETFAAIVPIGYADGIHRCASGFNKAGYGAECKLGGPVKINTNAGTKIVRVSGRVCMDQFIVDLGAQADKEGIREGDTAVLFGPGKGVKYGQPTADDWAAAAGTISYEIFTCLRSRIPRLYLNGEFLCSKDIAMIENAVPGSVL